MNDYLRNILLLITSNYEQYFTKYMYNEEFYDNEINLNKNLLKFGDKKQRKQAEKNLLELRGRLMFELRVANKQIKDILDNPNYE